jgi:hypothetical protein
MISLRMPSGGDERVDERTILVIRETVPFEREETPEVQACVWGGNYRLYPAETVASILEKVPEIPFARLTAPVGVTVLVNASKVLDRDDRTPVDEDRTNSVLVFGPGAMAPRVRVRETKKELVAIWTKLGLDPIAVDN